MKLEVFKIAQKVNIHLGYFCKKICHQELSKIAQFGHTARVRHFSSIVRSVGRSVGKKTFTIDSANWDGAETLRQTTLDLFRLNNKTTLDFLDLFDLSSNDKDVTNKI